MRTDEVMFVLKKSFQKNLSLISFQKKRNSVAALN